MKKTPTCALLVLLASVTLTACKPATAEIPTPLPTAVPPIDTLGNWNIGFQHEFGPDFWAEGTHRYAFYVHCPALISDYGSNWQPFEVSAEAELLSEDVYIRLGGLTTEWLAPVAESEPISIIHPSQQTVAAIYFTGLSREAIDSSSDDCAAFVVWDNEPPQALSPLDPFLP